MRYRVLGPLQVENGRGRSLSGWKEQAVLAQLLANANTALPADRLAYGLWGEAQPPTASRTLQAYVTRVRRAVGPADVGSTALITVADGWMLRVAPDEVDASVFEALLGQARIALTEGHAADARDHLKRALGLWRGDPYAGFDTLPACRSEAVRLAGLRKLAEDEWLAALLGAGDVEEVVTEAEGLLRCEPLRETRWALLIRAQCLAGRPADALEVYARARAVLRDELGADPGWELQQLQRAILAGDMASSVGAGGQVEIPEALARTGPRLVGRDAELDQLSARWAAASAGAGGLLVVSGVAGVGKTRLAAELARRAAGQRAVVRHASAGPDADPQPLLAQLLGGAAGRSVDGRGSSAPALVVLDDVRWVDGPLRRALPRLVTGLTDRPVLVLTLTRDEPGGPAVDVPVLRLGPLRTADVAEIAGSYQAGGVRIDVAQVVADARGLPQRAHVLAAAAASRAVARHIRAAAHEAERSRRGFTAVYDKLTEGVLAAEEIRRKTALSLSTDASAHPSRVPYQGLARFEAEDGEVFFGREQVTAEVVARLATGRFLAVVGASGSGKSSLVRAGLLPALRGGALPDSGTWEIDVVTPVEGDQSIIGPNGLLVVDQLEELFIGGTSGEVDRYLAALAEATRLGRVVVTLRSDFYPDAAAHPVLGPLLESGTAVLGPMRLEELRRVVVQPALAVGLDITDDLVDAVLQDVAGQPGALALLSVALLETYRRRVGSILGVDAYRAAGGVAGALTRLAEQVYTALGDAQRDAARRVLLRLAEEDRGRLVRRRAPLAEVAPAGDRAAIAAVEALARQRLLVVSDRTVEVAHEALLAAWPRCRGWLAADAAGRQVRSGLAAAAAAWLDSGRLESDLYRGMRLAAGADWAAGHTDELTPLERDFLDASRDAADQDRLAAEARAAYRARQARWLRYALAAVATFLVASLVAGLLAVRSARDSRARADAEAAARLGAVALTEPRVDTAALLAAQAVALHDSPETRADLLSTLLRWPQVRRVTVPTVVIVDAATGREQRVIRVTDEVIPPTVAFDPRTGALLAGNNDGTLGFWDPLTGRLLAPPVPGPPAYPRVLQVSDTGDRAATIGHDGSVAIWDTGARRLLARLPTHGAKASAIALAPDGKRLLVIEPDGTSTVWDLDQRAWQHAACALAGRPLTHDEWQRVLPGRPYRPACQAGGPRS